jgi:alcohol dehydrogenase (cytochrome c)
VKVLRFLAIWIFATSILGASFSAKAAPSAPAGAAYAANCAACHGEKLGGAYGPPLSGKAFKNKWEQKGAAALRAFISTMMPPAKPGSLDAKTYAELTRLVLTKNGLPPDAKPKQAAGEGADSGGQGVAVTNEDSLFHATTTARKALLDGMTPVTEAMLRNPSPDDWINWRRTDDAAGFSPLTQINTGSANRLEVAWTLSLPAGTNEITPLVHDGVMFVDSNGVVMALDAATGDLLWRYSRQASPTTSRGPPVTNPKNMAIYGTTLFVPTIDNHMIALNARTGAVLWDHWVEKEKIPGELRMTGGPLVVKGKVIQGIAGCSGAATPGGCFIVALDAATGKEVWRFYTIARPGEPGGDTWNGAPLSKRFGGSIWDGGSYDPELDLVYFGIAQTYHIAPLMQKKPTGAEPADALYTDTTVALNPDTGKLVWHYQHHAREVWDLDWAFERTIATVQTAQGPTKAVFTIGKTGILDAVDARTGRYLFSHDMGLQNLVTAIDPVTGRKTTDPMLEPSGDQTRVICPFPVGVRSWPATSYDAATKTLFVPMSESCMDYVWKPGEGWDIIYSIRPRPDSDGKFGRIAAINLETGQTVWQQRYRASHAGAALATAGGVLFEGSRDRWFRASNSATGEPLWKIRLDMLPNAFPITYARNGAQYVSVTTGGGSPVDVVWQTITPEIYSPAGATTLWVFKLAGENAAKR